MITIINYGLGNLNSVANMIRHVGGKCVLTGSPSEIAQAEKLVLPGVGSFDAGMEALRSSNILPALNEAVLSRQIPILGICLGMQLMTRKSEEGSLPGLGWIDGEVKRFCIPDSGKERFKVPHMGWNSIRISRKNPIIGDGPEQRFYFVHSYHVTCPETDVIAVSTHGYEFVAAFAHENIYGVQFHPEKSHRFGMKLWKNFLEI